MAADMGAGWGMDDLYNESYALVDQGICFDEVGDRDGALAMYSRGLELIDIAGKLPGANHNELFKKMSGARTHLQRRLADLRSPQSGDEMETVGSEGNGTLQPPQMGDGNDRAPSPYSDLTAAIDSFGRSKMADEIFLIPGGCQIFFIDGDNTSVPSYPGPLKIFRFRPDEGGAPESSTPKEPPKDEPPAFLQVATWVYPLVQDMAPSLKANWGAYVFPNPTAEQPDLYVGLLLPQDLDKDTRQGFEDMLKQYTTYQVEQQRAEVQPLTSEEKTRLSTKVAQLVISTSEYLVWGVEKGAELTGHVVSTQAAGIRSKHPACTEPVNVDTRLATSVHYLRRGTKVAVKCSGYLLDAIGEAAVQLGQRMARSVEKRFASGDPSSGGLVRGTVEVVGAGVAGFGHVWMGLENAARTLARGIANDTVEVVQHKYGPAAGNLTQDGLKAMGHGTMAAWNVYELGPKAIAKRTAKHAGLGLLKDLGGSSGKKKAIEGGSAPELGKGEKGGK